MQVGLLHPLLLLTCEGVHEYEFETSCVYAAHEALDGREVEGSNIRVSFANPSKSAQV